MPNYQDLVRIARDAARRAADYIRAAERPDAGRWDKKGLNDFATDVDRGAERIIGEILRAGTPGIPVMGEELSPGAADTAGTIWIVDPLDGTTNYLHGYPAYAVSIAAVADGTPLAGVVLDVNRNVEHHATAGGGAWSDDTRIRISGATDPAAGLIGTGFPFKQLDALPRYLKQFDRILRQTSGIRRAGSAAMDLADVARGSLDGFWELSLAPWDLAAGTLLVREAGGHVTTIEGDHQVIRTGSVVAGSPEIHRWLLNLLNDHDA